LSARKYTYRIVWSVTGGSAAGSGIS